MLDEHNYFMSSTDERTFLCFRIAVKLVKLLEKVSSLLALSSLTAKIDSSRELVKNMSRNTLGKRVTL